MSNPISSLAQGHAPEQLNSLIRGSLVTAAACTFLLAFVLVKAPAPMPHKKQNLPGITQRDPDLERRLQQALIDKGPDYVPRTRHLADKRPLFSNRLLLEKSPYLLQHAHNPVNWFPWGDEAFALAKKLNRPVFLSIGYSTCHWCHVMEEESFENLEIAKKLNENFIAIKVDREERPDLDAVYMAAVQTLTGRGGWPMSVWLTDDAKPFYGGTYFPPTTKEARQRIGFSELLDRLATRYKAEHDKVLASGEQIHDAIYKQLATRDAPVSFAAHAALKKALEGYQRSFDDEFGGMRVRTKFPSQLPIRLLLRMARRQDHLEAWRMAQLTLKKMAMGGMYDQLAGGFHRYSTDREWLVPHFEKMLYDNGQHAVTYTEAWQVAIQKAPVAAALFQKVSQETLRYVQREMTAPNGLFYSATDADSVGPEGEREEGYYFTWKPSELIDILGLDRAKLTVRYFGVSAKGNFSDRGRPTGRSVLHRRKAHIDLARELTLDAKSLQEEMDGIRAELLKVRNQRPPPLRDDKVLTSWNGLMISGFAKAALAFNDASFLASAQKAADVLLENRTKKGELWHVHTVENNEVTSRVKGMLDDYAFFISALLDVFSASSDMKYLQAAIELSDVLETNFLDDENGGYFSVSANHASLLVREKPNNDGAEPSGNSVHALNLMRLYTWTFLEKYRDRGVRTLEAFGNRLQRFPRSMDHMLLALDAIIEPTVEALVVLPNASDDVEKENVMRSALGKVFAPNAAILFVTENKVPALAKLIPWVAAKNVRAGSPTAYICEERVCQLPTTDAALAARHLTRVKSKTAISTSDMNAGASR